MTDPKLEASRLRLSRTPPEEEYASAAALFRALSHPLRVRLACGLLNMPLSQTGIARALGLPQPKVAQHLAVLRRTGILRGKRQTGEIVLEVADERLPAIFAALCRDERPFASVGWEEMGRSLRRETKAGRRVAHQE